MLSFIGDIFARENVPFVKQGLDFWVGIIEVVGNRKLTVGGSQSKM